MGKETKIQWSDATWNCWHGCKKISSGCKFCFMYRNKNQYGQDPTIISKSKTKFNAPLKWEEPKLIFVCSWSDFFIEEADEWRAEAWEIIKNTPHHTYQILTKRPERILECLPDDWGDGYENVWLGVSVENQEMADLRIPILKKIPSKVRFLSCEPLIGEVNLQKHIAPHKNLEGTLIGALLGTPIHWIIAGGESGNDTGKYRYRPSELEWFHEIVSQCKHYDVPVFMKQLGTHQSKLLGLKDRHGGNIDEWQPELQVREFPKSYKNGKYIE